MSESTIAAGAPHQRDPVGRLGVNRHQIQPPLSIERSADHWNHRLDDEHHSQPEALLRLTSAAQQTVLFEDTARAIRDAVEAVQDRRIANRTMADAAHGAGMAAAPGRRSARAVDQSRTSCLDGVTPIRSCVR